MGLDYITRAVIVGRQAENGECSTDFHYLITVIHRDSSTTLPWYYTEVVQKLSHWFKETLKQFYNGI